MANSQIRIVLADDHNLVRNGIASLLENCPGIYIVGDASNGRELINRYFECTPDVVVTDISMPLLTGIEAAEKILARDKSAKILFLSVNDSDEYVYKALKVGALGLINKSVAKGDLVLAIEKVNSGERYFGKAYNDEKLLAISSRYKEKMKTKSHINAALTTNELETLRLICEGMQSQEIAERLCLSKKTIDSYRGALMKKFKVMNTSQLIRYVFVNKILK